mgnify:CR=1 FL=1
MIQARNLVKRFGPKVAVQDVSFDVEAGEVLGFLGPNGAGKSTTMRMITGYLPPSAGTVTVGGHDIVEDAIAAKARIGYLPENAPAYPEMTVRAFLRFVAELHGRRGSERDKAVARVVETCFLQPVFQQPIETLSKGFRHRTCLAQALISDPPVLVLDEPTDGLDPNQKHEVRNLIRRMGREKAIIISTHILEEVDAVCSRIIIIDSGKLVFNGDPDDLRAKSRMAGAVSLSVRGANSATVRETLGNVDGVGEVVILDEQGELTKLVAYPETPGTSTLAVEVGNALRAKAIPFEELHTERGRLDEVFREITASETDTKGTPDAGSETTTDPEKEEVAA